MSPQSNAPLSHIRVLDLSRVLAGPLAGQFLADMGAEVIKIERPGTGDDTRGWGPPFIVQPSPDDPGLSAYFSCANRGKKSVAVDMASSEGQALIRRIAETCDVVIENFKVGGLVKYGLDYDSLRAVNPSLVYCSITGFGQDGPYATRAGYDFLVQGMGGLMSITGEPDTVAGGGPVKVGVAISDQMTGMNALSGILAALVRRERTGQGERVDVALLDSTVAALANQSASFLATGEAPGRMGNAHPTVVPYQTFATSDGHIILAVGNDRQFARFCTVAGLEHLAADDRFRSNAGRIVNRQSLIPVMADTLASRDSADWIATLEAAGVPCGPINTIDQVFEDPQVIARRTRRTLTAADGNTVDVVANPIRMATHDMTNANPPPLLGAQTAEVLKALLALSDAEISELARRGIVGVHPAS